MMRSLYRLLLVVVVTAGLAVFAICVLAVVSRSTYKCDPEGQTDSSSPDGEWHATLKIKGCHGLLMFTDFVSTVTVRKPSSANRQPFQIFASDSPDGVAFDWLAPDRLRIEVPSIATILASKRTFDSLEISYVVPADVLRDARNVRSALRLNDALTKGHIRLTPADQKASEQTNNDFVAYADRFTAWARDYAPPIEHGQLRTVAPP